MMTDRMPFRRTAAFLIACSSVGAPALAHPAVAMQDGTPAAETFSSADLRAYSGALVDLEAMRTKVAAQAAALPPDQRPALERQAANAMLAIVQRHGLDTATFNAMTKAVDRDPALRGEVRQAMMNEAIGT